MAESPTAAADVVIGADADLVPATRDELLGGDVVYLPIRHHSPACAGAVETTIRRLRPWAVLVEGPPAFDELIALLVDPAARMPLAVYAYVVLGAGDAPGGEQRIGTYFPVCDYSPELVALRTGAEVGSRLGFIDLDYPGMAAMGALHDRRGLTDDRLYAYSATLGRLQHALGCRDHNELWDHLVEAAALDVDAVVEAVAAYGQLARIGAADEDRPVTEAREAAMAAAIRRVRDERDVAGSDRPIAVVTGAYHTAVLPDLVATGRDPDPVDTGLVQEAGHGLVRYSFERLDALLGYGAGMPAPAWYQRVWASRAEPASGSDPSRVPAADETLAEVARALRTRNRDGQPSTPALIDAHAHVRLLATLRRRPRTSRADVLDAIHSCFVKGELAPDVDEAVHRAMTGTAVGTLPPGTARSPLSRDFDQRASALGLPLDTTEPRQLELDLHRSAPHRQISRFLHGVTALGVAFAVPRQQPRYAQAVGRDVLREIWICRFSAETDMTLTEAARWGASVPEAVEAHLQHALHALVEVRAGSDELLRLVLHAAQRGVHGAIDPILAEVRARVAADPELHSVATALTEAQLLWSARAPLDGRALHALPAVGEQLYLRACRLLDVGRSVADDQVEPWGEDIKAVHHVVRTAEFVTVDDSLFWTALDGLRHDGPPYLQGVVDGLRWHDARIDDDALAGAVLGHLAATGDPAGGAAYLRGLLAAAREALWHHPSLVPAISDFLAALDDDQFVRRLPGLRSAFAALAPRETDRVAEQLAEQHGIRATVRVDDQSEAELLAILDQSNEVTARLRADGLGSWIDGEAPP
jgi:hypothetical protein